MNREFIEINGARTHNLKDVSVNIPKNKLVVVTGKSGSGKSTLIMDTLFKYAKKNYLDALSTKNYSMSDNVDYDINYIKNIQPPVAIEQRRKLFNNPRSTIGTLTTIDGYLRILFSVAGRPVCPICFKEVDEELYCDDCGVYAEPLTPQQFSPTAKEGMCLRCSGIGNIIEFTEDKLIPDKSITVRGIWDTAKNNTFSVPSNRNVFEKLMEHYNVSWDDKYEDLSRDFQLKLLYGSDEIFTIRLNKVTNEVNHLGILTYLDNQYKKTVSVSRRKDLEVYLDNSICPECNGGKLRKESLQVSIGEKKYYEVQNMSFLEMKEYLEGLELTDSRKKALKDVLAELIVKVTNICNISVGYLSVNRQVSTLSGGELQRVLISQHISSDLTGVMYILDEPTIGLHERDTKSVIDMLFRLRDMGNTVIVVEHDEQVINSADYVIEVGPGAGKYGGEIIANGTVDEVLNNSNSLSSQYLRNRSRLKAIKNEDTKYIHFKHIKNHNLKDVSVDFPINSTTCVTGVSGCGKSSMISAVYEMVLNYAKGDYEAKGDNYDLSDSGIQDVIYIDQNPIKGSVRSNIMTYVGFNDDMRNIFYNESKEQNLDFTKACFSINVPAGRCEKCHGQGQLEIDMYFLNNEMVECDECHGKRFKDEILQVKHKDHSISDIFNLSVEEAYEIFKDGKSANIKKALKYLLDFGLGYLKLGQTTDSMSGGEAQRLHLITELMGSKKKETLFIFDEPSTGLHFSDIEYLIKLFNELIKNGHTVIIIEHNMDIIYNADYIVDLGPEAGINGGEVVFEGPIEDFIKNEKSCTAKCLMQHIKEHY